MKHIFELRMKNQIEERSSQLLRNLSIGGSNGGTDATWQPWNYQGRLKTAKKVENFKNRFWQRKG